MKLSPAKVAILRRHADLLTRREWATLVDVDPRTISDVVLRRTWANVVLATAQPNGDGVLPGQVGLFEGAK